MGDWWASFSNWIEHPLTRGEFYAMLFVLAFAIIEPMKGISRQIAAVAKLVRPDLRD
jgi:hypothetical protein